MLKKADKNANRLQRHKENFQELLKDQDYVYSEVLTIYTLK